MAIPFQVIPVCRWPIISHLLWNTAAAERSPLLPESNLYMFSDTHCYFLSAVIIQSEVGSRGKESILGSVSFNHRFYLEMKG